MRPLRLARAIGALCLGSMGCASIPSTGSQPTASGGAVSYALAGSGRPVVVLQSGLGDDRGPWASVIARMAPAHAVFAYDRPGYGDSTATVDTRDACTIARELHSLLTAAAVAPPYILVGHSLGGLYQYAFARLYPSEVAGLVLLDPTHPAHWRRMQAEAPAAAAAVSAMRHTVFTQAMRREWDDQDKCIEQLSPLPALRMPSRLLVRTRFALVERGAFENMVRSLQSDWMLMTGATRIEPVEGSGHYIQKDQPARVVAIIEAVAAQASHPGR